MINLWPDRTSSESTRTSCEKYVLASFISQKIRPYLLKTFLLGRNLLLSKEAFFKTIWSKLRILLGVKCIFNKLISKEVFPSSSMMRSSSAAAAAAASQSSCSNFATLCPYYRTCLRIRLACLPACLPAWLPDCLTDSHFFCPVFNARLDYG